MITLPPSDSPPLADSSQSHMSHLSDPSDFPITPTVHAAQL